jgi:hypothetical protein
MSAIYKDQVTLSADIVLEVVYASKKYQVHALTAMALRFMQKVPSLIEHLSFPPYLYDSCLRLYVYGIGINA